MAHELQRRLYGLIGAGFLLMIVAFASSASGDVLAREPVDIAQGVGLAVVGTLYVLSAIGSRVTEQVAWYQFAGLGNVLLGVVIPFGFLDGAIAGTSDPMTVVLVSLGAVPITAFGVDQLFFDGRYTYEEPLSAEEPSESSE